MERYIYMDNGATSQVKEEVLQEMLPYFSEKYGNPSSVHSMGNKSKVAIERARNQLAQALGAEAGEIFFTGGATEANNWLIKGLAHSQRAKGNHIITSKIEHQSVLHICQELEEKGFQVSYLDVDQDGLIDLKELEETIRDSTILISINFANNEIGTIQEIKKIGQIAEKKGVFFHTDAVQAVGHIKINVKDLKLHALSLSAHKFYGPKGVGALYIKKGTRIESLISGGGQEKRRRAGTENVPAIVGMGKAIELAMGNMEESNRRLSRMRDSLIRKIEENIDQVRLNGHRERRLAGNVNFSFEDIEGEALLLSLDMVGIGASSGSACTSGSLEPSHVLLALGLDHKKAQGSLRISLGDFNREEDIDYLLDKLIKIVERLRKT